MKVLCVTSDLLGNITFSAHLTDAIRAVPGVQLEVVRLQESDYRRYPTPAWMRMASPLRTRHVLRSKLRNVDIGAFDAIFLEFWEATLAFDGWLARRPVALAMDLVPTLASGLSLQITPNRWRRSVKRATWRVYNREFRRVLPHVDVFAPICSWVSDALERDYDVHGSGPGITYVPLNLNEWRPIWGNRGAAAASGESSETGAVTGASPYAGARVATGEPSSTDTGAATGEPPHTSNNRKRLLFVGNDFYRKGGDRLLAFYQEYLADIATLTIASRDPVLARLELPPGVTVLRDRSRAELLETYQEADLFLFPTRLDILPNALGEALATGTPCVATDIGGISELVVPGETGLLLPLHASNGEWGREVRALLENSARLKQLSRGARKVAETKLGLERFNTTVAGVVAQLCELRNRYGRS